MNFLQTRHPTITPASVGGLRCLAGASAGLRPVLCLVSISIEKPQQVRREHLRGKKIMQRL